MPSQPLDSRRPFPLELKSKFINRFCALWSTMTSIETPFRRRIAALHKWDEEVNGIKDASGFTIQAPRACVRVSLANGDEYLVRDEDELTWLSYEDVPQSARGAIRNFDNF